jgi:hypothetical protein
MREITLRRPGCRWVSCQIRDRIMATDGLKKTNLLIRDMSGMLSITARGYCGSSSTSAKPCVSGDLCKKLLAVGRLTGDDRPAGASFWLFSLHGTCLEHDSALTTSARAKVQNLSALSRIGPGNSLNFCANPVSLDLFLCHWRVRFHRYLFEGLKFHCAVFL